VRILQTLAARSRSILPPLFLPRFAVRLSLQEGANYTAHIPAVKPLLHFNDTYFLYALTSGDCATNIIGIPSQMHQYCAIHTVIPYSTIHLFLQANSTAIKFCTK